MAKNQLLWVNARAVEHKVEGQSNIDSFDNYAIKFVIRAITKWMRYAKDRGIASEEDFQERQNDTTV